MKDSELCVALAFSLQYVRLCVFCWMLLMTHNMYIQLSNGLHLVPITDNHINRNFIRYSLTGWGVPSILLAATVLVQYHDKAGRLLDTDSLKGENCWFLDKNAFIYGLVVPSSLLLVVTFYLLFRCALCSHFIISIQPDKRASDKMRRKRTLQIILFAKITVVLGMVLTLATMAKMIKYSPFWMAYHVLQGIQGILVSILVTCNCQILKLYTRSIQSSAHRHISYYANLKSAATISKSTSLQLLTWDPPPNTV